MFLNSLATVVGYVAATAITVQQPSDNEFKLLSWTLAVLSPVFKYVLSQFDVVLQIVIVDSRKLKSS